MDKEQECPFGGDEKKCEECAYYLDYKFNKKTGECDKKCLN